MTHPTSKPIAPRDRVALDGLSFLLADVQDNLGAFLTGVLTARHWGAMDVGLAVASGGVGAVSARLVGGWALDRLSARRGLLALCCGVTALSILIIAYSSRFSMILVVHMVAAGAGALLSPMLAAISQTVTSRRAYVARMGRNEAFNHLGNAAIGGAVAVAGISAGAMAGLWTIAGLSIVALALVFLLGPRADSPPESGDSARENGGTMGALRAMSADRRLVVFLLVYLLFNVANAGVVPLLIQRQASFGFGDPAPTASLCIVVAQIVMVPVAYFVGRHAGGMRRRPLLLMALCVLPLRPLIVMLSAQWGALCAAAVLDGFSSGIVLVLFYAILSDIAGDTPHRNGVIGIGLALGTIGALLSNGIGGALASAEGYTAGFLFLCLSSVAAFGLTLCVMPETANSAREA